MLPSMAQSFCDPLYGAIVSPNVQGMERDSIEIFGPQSSGRSGPSTDPCEALGMAPAAASIIRYYLLRPEACPHGREIQRVLGLGGASLQRELERMVSLGALVRTRKGRRIHYAMGPNAQLWAALSLMVGSTSDPARLIRDALLDVGGVRAAFLFGSTALGTQHSDSDVDIFVLEDPKADRRALLRQLAEAGLLLGREVNTLRYTELNIAERLGDPTHPGAGFMREVLTGPKRWVAGSPAPILLLTTAAGLRLSEVAAESG